MWVASSTPTSTWVCPDPPTECDVHGQERAASLHNTSISPPPPRSLQAQGTARSYGDAGVHAGLATGVCAGLPVRGPAPAVALSPRGAPRVPPPPRTRALGPVGLPAQRPTLTLALAPWGSPRRPRRSRSPQGAPCTASPLHPRSRSLPQPQRWTRARGDEGLGRGGSAHRAPRAGRPFAEGSALEIAPL